MNDDGSSSRSVIWEEFFADPNDGWEWEIKYRELDGEEPNPNRYEVCVTLRGSQVPFSALGYQKWAGASLSEVAEAITSFFRGSGEQPLAEIKFEWLPPAGVIESIPDLDGAHSDLLFTWTVRFCHPVGGYDLFRVCVETCVELQRQHIILESHHETMLIEAVFENGSPPREAVEMVASLRRAEGLD